MNPRAAIRDSGSAALIDEPRSGQQDAARLRITATLLGSRSLHVQSTRFEIVGIGAGGEAPHQHSDIPGADHAAVDDPLDLRRTHRR